ncbi:serine hydrolase domain-containing protein [Flavobacterium sp.]|uniref:serine hydrolase domain-containing protein n=1 Tax=Flavobacterium sp. TaxID=239 RepID=UPI002630F9BF|nr:serine hydrolase domain-containing protein [Flavobacterium sp.]
MRKVAAIIFFLFIATIGFAQKTVQFTDSIRRVYNIPEINYAVIDSKSTLEIAALGHHSINLSDTATLNDRFHIGSNTKAMTAFIIAKYVEKRKLKWTTKFFDLFPEWKTKSKPEYAAITLQKLLSHQAGIQPFQGEDDPEIPDFKGTNPEKRKQFGKFVLTLEPVKLDEQNLFIYSNAGYTLATLMLEKVTGKSWEQLVEKVFNQDLKLNVKLSWPENQKQKDTWGHTFENGKLIPVPSTVDDHLDYTEPAGNVNIKLKDYIKFIQLNLKGLQGDNNYLKADTYKFIHKGIENYSMGWFNIYENGKELSVHSGTGAFTYFTIVQIDRLKNIAYIIFTNSFNDETQLGVRLLMRKLKENYGS